MRWLPEVATTSEIGRSREERLLPWPKNLTKAWDGFSGKEAESEEGK